MNKIFDLIISSIKLTLPVMVPFFLFSCRTVSRSISLDYEIQTTVPFSSNSVFIDTSRIRERESFNNHFDTTLHFSNRKRAVQQYIERMLRPGPKLASKSVAEITIVPLVKCKIANVGFNALCKSQMLVSDKSNEKICESDSEWVSKSINLSFGREILADLYQQAMAQSLEEALINCNTATNKIKLKKELNEKNSGNGVTRELLKKAEKCQLKGGVWVNNTCQLVIE